MIRQEFIIVGCFLVVVGLAVCVVGYNKVQPTTAESVISFMETISGEKAPAEARTSKTGGYALLGGGAVCFLAGVGFILKSRTPFSATKKDP